MVIPKCISDIDVYVRVQATKALLALMSSIGKTYVRFMHMSCILMSDPGHGSGNS